MKPSLLRRLRRYYLHLKFGHGREYWIVKARRNSTVVIVAWSETREAALKVAISEGSNFLSMYRVYALNFNQDK